MKTTTIVNFINHSGVDISYHSVYAIVKGKEMSFKSAYKFSGIFTDKDILAWKKTKGQDFVSFFKKIIPESFLDETCGLSWEREKIEDRLGKEIIEDMKVIRTVPMTTLQWVADKHGITREYVRQLYFKYFGEPYTKAVDEKAEKTKDVACIRDPRYKVAEYKKGSSQHLGAVAEKLFMCRCELAGLEVVLLEDTAIDLMVNKNLVDVKSVSKTKTKYYHFGTSKKQTERCDFFACYVTKEDCFYIIPNKKRGKNKRNTFYIPVGRDEHKYSKYKDRFDLLI